MTSQQADALTLRIERTIRAPRDRVYNAWVDPEEMKKWSAPPGMTIPEGSQDLRVGGKFRAVMLEPNGTQHIAVGEYREVTLRRSDATPVVGSRTPTSAIVTATLNRVLNMLAS